VATHEEFPDAVIIRTPHRERFAVIDKRALEDDRLSWRARGLLAYLLSKPDYWEVMVGHLVKAAPTGRTIVRSTLRELEEFGYIVRTDQSHRGDGTFDAPDIQVLEFPQVSTGGEMQTRCDQDFHGVSPGHNRGRFTADGSTVDGGSPLSKEQLLVKTETSSSRASAPRSAEFESDFDECWVLYPRKVARKAALKAYSTCRSNGVSAEDLLTATANYRAATWGHEERFIMHGATFFGPTSRWEDYLEDAVIDDVFGDYQDNKPDGRDDLDLVERFARAPLVQCAESEAKIRRLAGELDTSEENRELAVERAVAIRREQEKVPA